MDHLVEVDEQQKFAWGDLWALGRGLPRARSGSGSGIPAYTTWYATPRVYTSVCYLICNRSVHTFKLLSFTLYHLILNAQHLILVACFRSDCVNYIMQERVQSTTLCIVEKSRCRFLIWTPSHHSHLTPVSAPSVAQFPFLVFWISLLWFPF